MSRALRMTEEQYAAKINAGKRVRSDLAPAQACATGTKQQGRPFPASGVLTPKPSKYRSRKTGAYSSRKEADRAAALKMLEKAWKIRNLREQVGYELIPRQAYEGKLVERACSYVADFVYEEFRDGAWHTVCEDVKGIRTKDYVIKRKLLLFVHGIRVRET